jgi:pimeloyl-ACP methyl ester carboxylesterase
MVERVGFDGGNITVEYELAPKMVVFSHDFATLRDGRGLLSDIASHLPHGYGYVLFDYYDTNDTGKTIQIKTFAEQLKRLSVIMVWLKGKSDVQQIDIVAHSLGCIVAAKLNPLGVRKLLMLAPPTVIADDLKQYTQDTGAEKRAGVWHIERADGVQVQIPDSFFSEIKHIDGDGELTELALLRDYTIVLPATDEVLPDADYTELITMPSVHAEAVDETDHYYEGRGRAKLLETVKNLLLS